MACDFLTKGRDEACKGSIGGIRNIYFIPFASITGYTYDGTNPDLVTVMLPVATDPINAYKFAVKGANSFSQSMISSREAGTTFVEQNLSIVLKELTIESHLELKNLTYGRPRVIIEDYNGNYFLAGLENGMEVETIAIDSGTALGDLSGYSLSLKGGEAIMANFVDATDEAGLVTAGLTIVN